MTGGRLSGPTKVILLVIALLVALLQTRLAVIAVLLGVVLVIAVALQAGWRLLAAARRGTPLFARVQTNLAIIVAVVAGVLAGGLVHRVRLDAAKHDAEEIVVLLDEARARTGRYPLSLDHLPEEPRLPAFAEDGFYSTSEYREDFTLRLTVRNGGMPVWWVYDSVSRRWAFVD